MSILNLKLFMKTHFLCTPGVNFINVFTHSFYARRSQKSKKLLELTVFIVLLGSGYIKAARKMLVKLTQVENHQPIIIEREYARERKKVKVMKTNDFALTSKKVNKKMFICLQSIKSWRNKT